MKMLCFKKILNFIIPKKKNYIYALPHNNGRKDCYDLLNSNSDNLLVVLKYLYNTRECPITVFLETYCSERIPVLKQYIDSFDDNRMKIILVESDLMRGEEKSNIKRKIRNMILRYRCKYWISDAGHCGYNDKISSQKFICLSYSSPYKSATNIEIYGDLSYIDAFLETSLLTASVHASEYYIKLKNCPILGFPRNDTLIESDRSHAVKKWISDKTNVEYRYLLVYAPTYRDYPNAYNTDCVFGFLDEDNAINSFLEKNKILVVAKLHPLQDTSKITYSDRILCYEASFDYSLYDLLSISDVLVSDYSSVIHDYIVTGKPVIMDFFDRDYYDETRGFAFEPIDYICPGPITTTGTDFIKELSTILNNDCPSEDYEAEDYKRVKRMFHRYVDAGSTKRVVSYLQEYMNIK